jgi:hypothetical protein
MATVFMPVAAPVVPRWNPTEWLLDRDLHDSVIATLKLDTRLDRAERSDIRPNGGGRRCRWPTSMLRSNVDSSVIAVSASSQRLRPSAPGRDLVLSLREAEPEFWLCAGMRSTEAERASDD